MKKAKNKPKDNPSKPARSPYFRSRVSQGRDLLPSIDGRSVAARVFRDTYLAMVAHCGGEDDIPETLRLMCRRAAAIQAECINLEGRFALARAVGEQPTQTDLDLYSRLVNTLRRVLEVLGWRRTGETSRRTRSTMPGTTTAAKLKRWSREHHRGTGQPAGVRPAIPRCQHLVGLACLSGCTVRPADGRPATGDLSGLHCTRRSTTSAEQRGLDCRRSTRWQVLHLGTGCLVPSRLSRLASLPSARRGRHHHGDRPGPQAGTCHHELYQGCVRRRAHAQAVNSERARRGSNAHQPHRRRGAQLLYRSAEVIRSLRPCWTKLLFGDTRTGPTPTSRS